MKTKEIDVWVSKVFIEFMQNHNSGYYRENIAFGDVAIASDSIKAKLIIEIPEKKIEITETEFDTAMVKVGCRVEMPSLYRPEIASLLKKELGFNND